MNPLLQQATAYLRGDVPELSNNIPVNDICKIVSCYAKDELEFETIILDASYLEKQQSKAKDYDNWLKTLVNELLQLREICPQVGAWISNLQRKCDNVYTHNQYALLHDALLVYNHDERCQRYYCFFRAACTCGRPWIKP